MKRIGRYLIGKTRASISYKWQGREEEIDGYTDSDWAGCRETGKSTSGGVLMIGGHFIKGWSKTQNSIALSSAEAELIAMAKLSAEALGLISLARDLGEEKIGKVWADSSAAIAIVNRLGAGKLRHIHIGSLWIQEVQKDRRLKFHKVAGVANCADLMTKNIATEVGEGHRACLGIHFAEGRSIAAPTLSSLLEGQAIWEM